MADLRKVLDVQSLKEPTRPLRELLKESTAESKREIVASGRQATAKHALQAVAH